jgi:hypothetical protein
MNTADQNFAALGLTLPPAPKPLGVYKPYLIDGNYFICRAMDLLRMMEHLLLAVLVILLLPKKVSWLHSRLA